MLAGFQFIIYWVDILMKSWIVAFIGLAIGSVIGVLLSMIQAAGGHVPVAGTAGSAIAINTDSVRSNPPAITSVTGPARVIDGDTLQIGQTKIRMLGIDTPETGQQCTHRDGNSYRCGDVASNRLRELIGLEHTRCEGQEQDRYGRLLATCYNATANLNAEMVRLGWAVAYRQYSNTYISLENEARQAARGLWEGSFQMPWDWRQESRSTTKSAPVIAMAEETGTSGHCLIKGNISENGQIYHMPGSRWYARTRINKARGERLFCSAREAEAAGWRKAT